MATAETEAPRGRARSLARAASTRSARAVTYSVVALLACLAARRTPPAWRPVASPTRPLAVAAVAAPPVVRPIAATTIRPPAAPERSERTLDTVVVSGTVRSTLAAALAEAATEVPRAQRTEIAYTLADIFEYRVDMSRDLQPGDGVRVLVELSRGRDSAAKVGRVLAARLDLSGTPVVAVRFASDRASGDYFDASGKSLNARFLRAPLAFRRVSSGFGRRMHPILGVWRQHSGMDYAAASGTPVRAIGDGVVIRAGRAGGYGNVLDIRLRNGYVTRYGHLRTFARGLRRGTRVSVGQTVAFVGTTGLSTAPHLHFEMLLNGRNRDPRVALRQLKGGEPIARRERDEFAEASARLLAALGSSRPAELVATTD